LAINGGNQSGHQPARLTELNNHRQSSILIKGGEGTAQVINLAHGSHPSVSCSDDGANLMPSPVTRIASAAIGIAQSARPLLPKNGWPTAKPIS
jgi:hypothetical protein